MSSTTSRRTFVKGLAAGSLLGGLGLWRTPVWALNGAGPLNELSGNQFELFIGETAVNFSGSPRTAMTINGSLPGPLLRWREGDTVTLRVRNRLSASTSIHWHGILLPANMDGVPGLSFHGIEPGGVYVYQFKVRQHGTYWYHSHSGLQEQAGVYGPLVIEAKEPEPFQYDRDCVVMLSDWTDEDPASLMKTLKNSPTTTTSTNAPSATSSMMSGKRLGRHRRRSQNVGANEHEPHRHRRRQWRHVHLPDERPGAR